MDKNTWKCFPSTILLKHYTCQWFLWKIGNCKVWKSIEKSVETIILCMKHYLWQSSCYIQSFFYIWKNIQCTSVNCKVIKLWKIVFFIKYICQWLKRNIILKVHEIMKIILKSADLSIIFMILFYFFSTLQFYIQLSL